MNRDYHNPPPPRQYGKGQIYREQSKREQEAAALKAAGLLPHKDNPDDPWSSVTNRTCGDNCEQHQRSTT